MALNLNPETGLLNNVRYLPSPNCDARPDGCIIELVVIHGISLPPGCYGEGYVDHFFTNTLDSSRHTYFAEICHLQVSSHLFIDREGAITQYVPLTLRAWHAGESEFQGRRGCNDFSIGIELEGCDDEPYALTQYAGAAEIVRLLMQHWPAVTRERIVGHADIAPGRKTDPGPAFDWQYFYTRIDKG
jgi:AmpD protein